MDDYVSEIEQWERVKQWLKENGAWIVAGVLLGVGGLYAWDWWQDRVTSRAQAAATRYSEVLEALQGNDRTRAQQLADSLAKDYGETPYVDQAKLVIARSEVAAGKLDEAAKRLRDVATGAEDQELRSIARLRLARVQLMQKKPDEALATLGQAERGAFGPAYEEVKGDALLAKGDSAGALSAYRKAAESTEPAVVDQGLLQLKINELAAAQPAAPPAEGAAAAPSEESAK